MLRSYKYILLSLLIAVMVIIVVAWLISDKIRTDSRTRIAASLTTVLNTTNQALKTWIKENKSSAAVWANTPEIRRFTRSLLALPATRNTLIHSRSQRELRRWLHPIHVSKHYQGYFIIGPGNINLASSRDVNIGIKNLLTKQKGYLDRLWAGKTAISLPQRSDVPLPDKDGVLRKGMPTMFVGAPILDGHKRVIAIFTFRINPAEDFTDILRHGHIGHSGETYAFNRDGVLISNSRFDDQLRQTGLIQPHESGILNITLRDPGVDLVKGQSTTTPRTQQPLTRMAKSAIAGNSGIDLDGYRDYRGVPVIGAWTWNEELGLGVATEIDTKEIYLPLTNTYLVVATLTTLSIVLLTGLTLLFIVSRKRLQKTETKMQGIVNTVIDAIITVDEKGVVRSFSPGAELTFGYQAKEVIGKSVNLLMPESYSVIHDNYVANYVSGKGPKVVGKIREEKGRRKNGEIFPVEISLSELINGDTRVFVGVLRDITERERAEAQFRQIVENSPIPMAITDIEGNIEHYNKKFIELFGWTTADARTPEEWWNVAYPDEEYRAEVRGEWEAATEKAIASGKEIEPQQWKLTCKNGDIRDVVFKMVRVGENRSAITMDDITERLHAEEELRQHRDHLQELVEERTRELQAANRDLQEEIEARRRTRKALEESELWMKGIYESLEDAVLVVTPDRKIVNVNQAGKRIFGHTREELEKLTTEVLHVDHEHYLEFGKRIKAAFDKNKAAHFEFETRRKNGDIFPSEHTVSLLKNNQGEAVGIVSMVRDISKRRQQEEELKEYREHLEELVGTRTGEIKTINEQLLREVEERKQKEVELRESEERFSGVIRMADDGIISVDESYCITLFNDAAQRVFGYARDEVLGKTLDILIPGRFHDLHRSRMNGFKKAKESTRQKKKRIELIGLRKNSDEFPMEAAISKLDMGGKKIYTIILRDITERKQAEAELRKHREHLQELIEERTAELRAVNKELEAFSYSVSHDLRAPLRSIDGFSQALQEDCYVDLDDTGKDYLDRIRAATQRMGSLIDDLLDLSRVTRAELKREDVNLSAVAEEIIQELRDSQPDRQVDISVESDIAVTGDASALRVVMFNLLSNAWKFTSTRTQPHIEFGVRKEGAKQIYYVRDNGVGFDLQFADKLFGVFQRLHKLEEFEGTGIGLATVQRIIHRHGGKIWAESEVDKGATFFFTLSNSL